MARKVVFLETGGPEVLQILEVPDPIPGPGEVRIRVRAIGINRAEINQRAGTYGQPAEFPASLGLEASGVVDEVGTGVTDFAVGDSVSVLPAFNTATYSMYGDLVLVPFRALVKTPPALTVIQAAALWMPFATAWLGLIHFGNVVAGDFVLITAASSSVGLASIQIARNADAVPVALTRTETKANALRNAGAAYVIVTDHGIVQEQAATITEGAGARVVFDAVGGRLFEVLLASTAANGVVVIYGALGKEVNTLPAITAIRRQLTIQGIAATSAFHDDTKLAAMKAYVTQGVQSGAFRPQVTRTFPFEEVAAAHQYVESNDHFGKIVLTV